MLDKFFTKNEIHCLYATIFIGLLSCSSNSKILNDYELIDLGGSNQSISNRSGTVEVDDVTAYSVSGNYIYIEHGGRYNKSGDGSNGICKYSIINTVSNRIFTVYDNKAALHKVVLHIKKNGQGVVKRSCVG